MQKSGMRETGTGNPPVKPTTSKRTTIVRKMRPTYRSPKGRRRKHSSRLVGNASRNARKNQLPMVRAASLRGRKKVERFTSEAGER